MTPAGERLLAEWQQPDDPEWTEGFRQSITAIEMEAVAEWLVYQYPAVHAETWRDAAEATNAEWQQRVAEAVAAERARALPVIEAADKLANKPGANSYADDLYRLRAALAEYDR